MNESVQPNLPVSEYGFFGDCVGAKSGGEASAMSRDFLCRGKVIHVWMRLRLALLHSIQDGCQFVSESRGIDRAGAARIDGDQEF